MELFLLLMLGAGAAVAVSSVRARRQQAELASVELAKVKAITEEDVTRFGEELQRLDVDVTGRVLDEATRQDYQRALDAYEGAKSALDAVQVPAEVRGVTEALEDGRYAMTCVRARVAGQPLPVRRPPCFFNPAHGPSAEDVDWAPAGGAQRRVPVCAADAERVHAGAEPDVRKVLVGAQRRPYWEAGPAYSPWVGGYFGGYAMSGLLPGFLLGSMLTGWDGGGYDAGYGDGYGDAGGDAGDYGDGGDYSGGDYSGGGDFSGGSDFGGFGDF